MSEANLRKPASLWLAITTLFGLAGTFIGILPVVATLNAARAGTVGPGLAIATMAIYCSLLLCPLTAWWMLLRRQYRLALIIASPPILIWLTILISSKVSG
jgi:hypothetical protein